MLLTNQKEGGRGGGVQLIGAMPILRLFFVCVFFLRTSLQLKDDFSKRWRIMSGKVGGQCQVGLEDSDR